MKKFVNPQQLAQQAMRLQEYENRKNIDEINRLKKEIDDGYNFVLPPLNATKGHVRGLTTDFVPTTNSSSNWNGDATIKHSIQDK